METRSHILLVSAVVALVFAALMAFVFWLMPDDGAKGRQYDILFDQSVSGLVEGAPVTFAGIPVGRVRSIGLNPGDLRLVRVRVSIIEDDLPIFEGTSAALKRDFAFGTAMINLEAPERSGGRPVPLDADGVGLIRADKPGFGEFAGDPGPMIERIARGTDMLLEMTSPAGREQIEARLDATVQSTAELARKSADLDQRIAGTRAAIRATGSAATGFAAFAGTKGRTLQARGQESMRAIRAQSAAARDKLRQLDATMAAARPQVGALSDSAAAAGTSARGLREQVSAVRETVERVEDYGLGSPSLPDYKPKD